MPDRNSVLLGRQLGLLCNNVSILQMNTVNCGLSLLAVRLEFSGLGLAKWSSLHRCLARPVLYITGGRLALSLQFCAHRLHLQTPRTSVLYPKFMPAVSLNHRWTRVGSIHGLGWAGLNEKYCGIVAEYCRPKTRTFHCP